MQHHQHVGDRGRVPGQVLERQVHAVDAELGVASSQGLVRRSQRLRLEEPSGG